LALASLGVAHWVYAGCGACQPGACALPKSQPAAAPQVTRTPPFEIHAVTGPLAGKELCYICRNGGKPTVVIFTRTADGLLGDVVARVDKLVAEHQKQGLASFVVLLDEKNEENANRLKALAEKHNLTTPLTIAASGANNPKGYNLPETAPTTSLVANRNKVHASYTLGEACKVCTAGAKVEGHKPHACEPCEQKSLGQFESIAEAAASVLNEG
jgi:hypothetical protein